MKSLTIDSTNALCGALFIALGGFFIYQCLNLELGTALRMGPGYFPLVLAVMGGAVVFAGQILPLLRFPLDFDYIHASRYGAATRGALFYRNYSVGPLVTDEYPVSP